MTAITRQDGIQRAVEGGSGTVRSRPPAMMGIREAVRRVVNSDRYEGSRAPEAVRAWIRRLVADVDDPDRVVRVGKRLWIHPSVHPAFSELPARDRSAEKVKSLPQGKRNRLLAKLRAIRDLEVYRRANGLGRVEARARFARERATQYTYRDGDAERVLHLTAGSLWRWQRQYAERGADGLAKDGRGQWGRARPDSEAEQLYWALRNSPHKHSIAHCYRQVASEGNEHGWQWFRDLGTCQKWDRRTRDERALMLNREGDQKYTQRYGRYVEIDPESFEPGECWVGDDHDMRVWVRCPDGKVLRPVLSVWQDWRSRVIIGRSIVRQGNEHALLAAFGLGADHYRHIPGVVIADNGKNFTSWQWRGDRPKRRVYRRPGELAQEVEGIFALCDIRPSWCLPYNPNGKPRLERWFRTLEEQFCKSFASYCGSAPDNRPEAHKDLVAKAVDWNVFVAKLDQYIAIYQDRPHSAEDMGGQTPLQVLNLATRRRVLDEHVRPLLLSAWHRPVSIGRNGVAVRICATTVRYGAGHPAIAGLPIHTKVRVSFDPEDVSSIMVWSMEYAFICQAQANRKMNRKVPSEALREEMRAIAREKRALREATKVGLDHLRNPVDRTLAALARDSARRRLPDRPGPDGGPVLVPVQAPIVAPAAGQLPRKVAVGAENMSADMEVRGRFAAFVKQSSASPKSWSASGALRRWAERQGG